MGGIAAQYSEEKAIPCKGKGNSVAISRTYTIPPQKAERFQALSLGKTRSDEKAELS